MNLETKWLEDFVALAATRSFSQAAQRRFVTQPAFSRRIRSLEAALGLRLLERTTRRLRLTEAGQRWFAELQIDVEAAAGRRRHLCRPCLDWSERRHHLGGALGGRRNPSLIRDLRTGDVIRPS